MKTLFAKTSKELWIEASSEEWYAFARALLQDGSTIVCENVTDPTPFETSLSPLNVVHKPESKVIFVPREDGTCLIEGDPANLEMLSVDAETLAREYRNFEHIHIEYVGPGPDYYVGKQQYSVVLANEDH